MKKDIYVFQNGRLSRKDNTLCLEIDEKKHYIPVVDVGSIHFFGEVDVNKSLLEFASQNHILIHYYNYYGYYVGTYYPREYLNSGYVILQQCSAYLDYEKRLYLASKFIEGAAKNILQVLKYYDRREKDLNISISEIESLASIIKEQDSVEKIMAIEGNIRQIYYQEFNKIIDKKEFYFSKRSKRPPEDKINALISFGNTIVYNEVLSQIYQTQLDPRIGFLHSTNDRRFSLNLDIAELFKPLLVDRTIFLLLNKKQITSKDFKKELGGILLNDKGRKEFIQEIDKKLKTTVQLPGIGHRISYKGLIRMEAYKIQKYLTENKPYAPFEMKW
ncbi:CRISPR-associated protein Cas1 [Lachnospiraceae bacterium TWA4]|nr:CRISPR-associated protein Cas1 [Lachnospiraceae bacterium TWA4]